MADVRYSVPGVPPDPAKGITAFSPAFIRHAASSALQYKQAVQGFPGTRGIPMSARVNSQISPDYGDLAQAGTARSSDAPDTIWPNQYYQDAPGEPGHGWPDAGVAVYSPQHPGLTTLLPVPAEDGRATYQARSARLAYRAVLQRVAELPWFPRVYVAPRGGGNAPGFGTKGDNYG
jgi:hypothetical protein